MEPRRRFRFLKELSEGAFGKVYLAEMITGDNFKSVVAIKLLHGKWTEHEEIVKRSRDEARVLGLLHHRNIIRVDDLTSINGQCAIVMEYLDGVDIKTFINYCRDHEVTVPRRVAFDVTSQIASALEAAYYKTPLQGGDPLRLIHRDIKPSNVMVTVAGDVKVLDFGTAQAHFDDREAHTQALAFGSAAYMAPERLLGDPDAPSGDVFSLGITLYEMLSLKSFGKIHIRPEKFEQKLQRRLPEMPLDDLTDERAEQVRTTLKLMLAYDADDRPSAGQVVDLMEALAEEMHDGTLRRFCREIVQPCRAALKVPQNPNDPLTGSTLFEDHSVISGPTHRDPLLTWVEGDEEEEIEFPVVEDEAPFSVPPELLADPADPAPQFVGAPPPRGAEAAHRGGADMPPVHGAEGALDDVSEERDEYSDAYDKSGGDTGPVVNLGAPPLVAARLSGDHGASVDSLHPEAGVSYPVVASPTFDDPVDDEPVEDDVTEPPDALALMRLQEQAAAEASVEAPADPTYEEGVEGGPPSDAAVPDNADSHDAAVEGAASGDAASGDAVAEDAVADDAAPASGPDDDPAAGEDGPRPDADVGAEVRPVAIAIRTDDDDDDESEPRRRGGGLLKFLIIAGLLIGFVGAAGIAIVVVGGLDLLKGGGDDPVVPEAGHEPDVARDLVSGGVVEVGAEGSDVGTVRLTLGIEGVQSVNVFTPVDEFKSDWDGTGTLELHNATAGLYRANIDRAEGGKLRTTLDVVAGQTCSYTFDDPDARSWKLVGCD